MTIDFKYSDNSIVATVPQHTSTSARPKYTPTNKRRILCVFPKYSRSFGTFHHALPRTPLWRRLEKEGRLLFDDHRESNIEFLMPYKQVVEMWRHCITSAYEPDFLYQRFAYQMQNTYPNRIQVPNSAARVSRANIIKGLRYLTNILVKVGVFSNYRKTFWQMATKALKKGDIESLIHIALVAHHLIKFGTECGMGQESASFYSQRVKNFSFLKTSRSS